MLEGDAPAARWRFWVDTGGTFTDCLALDPEDRLHRVKVLSSSVLRASVAEQKSGEDLLLEVKSPVSWPGELGPRSRRGSVLPSGFLDGWSLALLGESETRLIAHSEDGWIRLAEAWGGPSLDGAEVELRSPEEAALLAVRLITESLAGQRLPMAEARLATTLGTNALLERRGSPTVLFVTRGLGEILEIGSQQRPDLFKLRVEKPAPLYAKVVEVDERLSADGSVLRPLDLRSLEGPAKQCLDLGLGNGAIALLHSFRNPEHEEQLADYLKKLGFRHLSTSSGLSARIKILPRARTAVVDSYLAEIIGGYLERVASRLGPRTLHVMTSAGGLVGAEGYHPKDSLLSGPAGGVVGAAAAGRRSGEDRVLAFDMGGTSTDVTRCEGDLEYRSETEVGGIRLASPSLAVETVAAGGGSVCRFDGRQLKVGPESGGADPGPACYGRGGPLTLTDVNLLLGRLAPEHFPFEIDQPAAVAAADRIVVAHETAAGARLGSERLLWGFLQIANEKMAAAVRRISLRAGYRPSDYVLVGFGGAGPQHACSLADLLGIDRVLVPADAALLSAHGLGASRLERFAEEQVLEPLDRVQEDLPRRFERLAKLAAARLEGEGLSDSEIEAGPREIFLRFGGQEETLRLRWNPETDLLAAFRESYEGHYGYCPRNRRPEVESLRVVVRSRAEPVDESVLLAASAPVVVARLGAQPLYSEAGWAEASVFERRSLVTGSRLRGPALVVEEHCVTVIEQGWVGTLDSAGALSLVREGGCGDG
jgi:5-oxoprolinase (ATP-hydrolysing)